MEDHQVLEFVSCDVCDRRGRTVRRAASRLGGGEVRQRRCGAGARTLRRGPRTAAARQGSVEKLQRRGLGAQLNATFGDGFVSKVSATVRGHVPVDGELRHSPTTGRSSVSTDSQLKFGPSAWFANERDPHWKRTVDPEVADYSRLFLTRAKTKEVRQSDGDAAGSARRPRAKRPQTARRDRATSERQRMTRLIRSDTAQPRVSCLSAGASVEC